MTEGVTVRGSWQAVVGAASLLLVAACGGGTVGSVRDADLALTPERLNAEYRLGAGDAVRIIVFDEPDLSGEFVVGGGGSVSLPLIGEVPVGGKTLREFETAVAQGYSEGYLRDPRVSAEILNYRPFYILGEVNQPGEYPYTDGLTVLNAVATANGFTYRANLRRVFIKRADEPGEVAYSLTTETKVLPGDTIRIAERYF
ncbi:MAG: polysaccharide export protein [Caulobacterales bacterium]|nr:polysaccharide export protein [Caulobacterales bacterium]